MKLPEELKRYKEDFLTENTRMSLTEAIVRRCAKSCLSLNKDIVCPEECANAVLDDFGLLHGAQALQIKEHGISVNVGEDGTWVFFNTKSGKGFAFQPIQEWADNKIFFPVIHDWCREMQAKYEASK